MMDKQMGFPPKKEIVPACRARHRAIRAQPTASLACVPWKDCTAPCRWHPTRPASGGIIEAFVRPGHLPLSAWATWTPATGAPTSRPGAEYRYGLLWVVALSSLMAIIMQVISARLGVVTGKDLAQACRDFYWEWTRWPLWILCEVAIGAWDLAESAGQPLRGHHQSPVRHSSFLGRSHYLV